MKNREWIEGEECRKGGDEKEAGEQLITGGKKTVPNRTMKDSVFRDLFSMPEYLLELYRVLHPEDTAVLESDFGNVTIKNVLMANPYNDLGFTVRNMLLVMVEAQSTWTVNIVVRLLVYLAETWAAHVSKTSQNMYGSKAVQLPEPEFYVIFTGERANRPEWISLSDEFLHSERGNLELKAKVLYSTGKGDILDQYITFTNILAQQLREREKTREAVRETIRICKDKNILKKYLEEREEEVIGMMSILYDEEYLNRVYTKEQREIGEHNMLVKNVVSLRKNGYSDEEIANMLEEELETIKEIVSEDMIPA